MYVLPRSTPESMGIPSEIIRKTIEKLNKLDSMNSIMILRHGHVCAEAWWKPYSPSIPHELFSLSKSFVSVAVGCLREEGKLKLTDKLVSFFPEYADRVRDPKMDRMELRHLLMMGAGHGRHYEEYLFRAAEKDPAELFLGSELEFEPGTHFQYNSSATYMLASVVRKVSGENVREYLMPRLFDPLGIQPGIWENSCTGTNLGGWGFYLKTEDIAKFAQLILEGGKFGGKQLIPEDYIREASSMQNDNSMNQNPDWKCGYGYQFWISQHGFRGDGACGQYALILPEQDMAIATTAGLRNMQDILTVIWENLLPGVSDILPENPEEHGKLTEVLRRLEIPFIQGDITARCAPFTWKLGENAAGISSVSLDCGKDRCTLKFENGNGTETITAGFGFLCDNLVKLQDSLPRRGAARAAWLPDGTLQIQISYYETPFRDIWFIHPENRTIRCQEHLNFLHPVPGPLTVL